MGGQSENHGRKEQVMVLLLAAAGCSSWSRAPCLSCGGMPLYKACQLHAGRRELPAAAPLQLCHLLLGWLAGEQLLAGVEQHLGCLIPDASQLLHLHLTWRRLGQSSGAHADSPNQTAAAALCLPACSSHARIARAS